MCDIIILKSCKAREREVNDGLQQKMRTIFSSPIPSFLESISIKKVGDRGT